MVDAFVILFCAFIIVATFHTGKIRQKRGDNSTHRLVVKIFDVEKK